MSIIAYKRNGIVFPVKEHDCNMILLNKETTEIQIERSKMLEEAEKILKEDRIITSYKCYRRVIRYEVEGIEKRMKILSKKDIDNLRSPHFNAIKVIRRI